MNAQETTAYVINRGTHGLYAVAIPTGTVTTVHAGSPFSNPQGVALNTLGTTAYVIDYNTDALYAVTISTGAVITVAGSSFGNPVGVAVNAQETLAYVIDNGNKALYAVAISTGTVTTIRAGSPFSNPLSIALNALGTTAYVTDPNTNSIYSVTVATASGVGDPSFVGFAGQQYQVHGIDGGVYSIIYDPLIRLNSRFAFLTAGKCPSASSSNCWSHPGSYMSNLALATHHGHRLLIESGAADIGFESVVVNEERHVKVGETLVLSHATAAAPNYSSHVLNVNRSWTADILAHQPKIAALRLIDLPLTIEYTDTHSIVVNAGIYKLSIENSDQFVNIVSIAVNNTAVQRDIVRSHGLLGQTHTPPAKHYRATTIPAIAGQVDDYAESRSDLFGQDFGFLFLLNQD